MVCATHHDSDLLPVLRASAEWFRWGGSGCLLFRYPCRSLRHLYPHLPHPHRSRSPETQAGEHVGIIGKKLYEKDTKQRGVVIYQAKSGAIELKGDFTRETLWATQAQIAGAFDVDVRTINEHITTIYKPDEQSDKSTIRKFRIVQ